MTLEAILKEIKEVKPFADGDAEAGPIETLRGRRGRKAQAQERLKQLRRQYSRDLMRTAQFLVVTGSLRNELTEQLTTGKINLFSADPEQFYKDLASRVNPALFAAKHTAVDLFDVIGRHLEDKASELDITECPQIIFREKYSQLINKPEQLVSLVRLAVNEQMGTEIVGIQSVNSIIDKAIEQGHDSKTTSIVLNVESPELVNDILRDFDRLTNRVYLLVAGETKVDTESKLVKEHDPIYLSEVNNKTVKHTLDTVRKNSRGQENKNS